jgi:hypothetical protein
MPTGSAGVAAAKTTVTATAAVTSAMLRPQRYGQRESERRDGYQAAHTASITL